jgi:hypothetical protein
MPVSTRGGRNHGGATPSIRAFALAALLALAAALAPTLAWAQATPEENPLIQRNVPAEATAENAVVARDRALVSAQRLAYERMAGQMNLPRDVSDAQIERMVQSLVIESERISIGRYSGRITVNFNPNRVAEGGGGAGAGGAGGSGFAGTLAPAGAPPRPGAAVATMDAVARYGSFREWLEINRRLAAAGPVAKVEVVTISGQMARLRIGLRSDPAMAAADIAAGGLSLGTAPIGAPGGEGWRLSLAGGR